MEISFGIYPDEELKKVIDNLRFQYDRTLIKEKYPYIQFLGPVQSFANMKRVAHFFTSLLKGKKRFKLSTGIVEIQEDEQAVSLNVFHKGEMQELYHTLLEELEMDESSALYMPHIILAKNHHSDKLYQIYEELKEKKIQYSFFSHYFCLYEKSPRHWEEYLVVEV